jgi:uncharacterized protein (UPF0335 family)
MTTYKERKNMYPDLTDTPTTPIDSVDMTISKDSIVKDFYEQVKVLEDEKRAAQDTIKEKFLEAKSAGVDPKILKSIMKKLQKTKAQREEEAALEELYMAAIGVE